MCAHEVPYSQECAKCDALAAFKIDPTSPAEPLQSGAAMVLVAEVEASARAALAAHYPDACPRCGGPAYLGIGGATYECAANCEREAARKAAEVERIMASATVRPILCSVRREITWCTNDPPIPGNEGATAGVDAEHPTRDGALALLRAQVERVVRG